MRQKHIRVLILFKIAILAKLHLESQLTKDLAVNSGSKALQGRKSLAIFTELCTPNHGVLIRPVDLQSREPRSRLRKTHLHQGRRGVRRVVSLS